MTILYSGGDYWKKNRLGMKISRRHLCNGNVARMMRMDYEDCDKLNNKFVVFRVMVF